MLLALKPNMPVNGCLICYFFAPLLPETNGYGKILSGLWKSSAYYPNV